MSRRRIVRPDLVAEQKQRGIVANVAGVRTEHYCWATLNPADILFELEVPIAVLDRLMLEFGRYNVENVQQYHAAIAAEICEKSFCLSAKKSIHERLVSESLVQKNLRFHLQDLLHQEMPHAVYRIQLLPNRLVLSSYTQAFAVGDGSGQEFELSPVESLALRIDYPLNCRDKSDFAIIRFYSADDVPAGRASLIRFEEFCRVGDKNRLVQRIETAYDNQVAGYRIEVTKKKYVAAD